MYAVIGASNARALTSNAGSRISKYRETHTADYMTDYQARELQPASGELTAV